MIKLQFPAPDFNTRKMGESLQVFDRIRMSWVALQPEEWVRQNLINWFIQVKQIPKSVIAIEQSLKINVLSKRCDILIYDRNHMPWMMVEVKAQGVELNAPVLAQILNYHMGIPVRFIMITNGDACFVADIQSTAPQWLDELPDYV